MYQIKRSWGGTFNTLSISSLGLQYSWALGEYVPLVARLFLAIIKNAAKNIPPMIIIPTNTGININAYENPLSSFDRTCKMLKKCVKTNEIMSFYLLDKWLNDMKCDYDVNSCSFY